MTFPEGEDSPVILEYVIADYRRINMITRTYVVNFEPKSAEECPVRCICIWDSSKMIPPCPDLALTPVAICRDPFRLGRHKIVLCEARYVDKPDKIVEFNTRIACKEMMDKVADKEPLYTFEQEYFVVDENDVPLDWSHYSQEIDFDFEINVGSHSCIERDLAETHLRACLYAGLTISGMNREMFPSQWEYQVGPLPGLEACDQVYISRYILMRLAEMNNLHVTFKNPDCTRDTKVRSAMHLNFSTKQTREDGGIEHLHKLIENVEKHPQEAIMKYYDLKKGKEMRWFLSGIAYMPHYDEFICKVGEKDGCTIRIPARVAFEGKGYLEERRPTSDSDPYDVCRVFTAAAVFEANGL
ncbi:glutamine synthetase-like [Mercenaria mercenaria]|uniref:glutamine synthetase-like n=1 Tax=Mercenaria mercenaria TaxID=6596 RepID=UPI00234E6D64|nr:glutamine synthetase-like [Mercenaria mercenaria]